MSILHGSTKSRCPTSKRSEVYDGTTLNREYIELEEGQSGGLDVTAPQNPVANEIRGYENDDRRSHDVMTKSNDIAPPGRILRTVKIEQSDTWMT